MLLAALTGEEKNEPMSGARADPALLTAAVLLVQQPSPHDFADPERGHGRQGIGLFAAFVCSRFGGRLAVVRPMLAVTSRARRPSWGHTLSLVDVLIAFECGIL